MELTFLVVAFAFVVADTGTEDVAVVADTAIANVVVVDTVIAFVVVVDIVFAIVVVVVSDSWPG